MTTTAGRGKPRLASLDILRGLLLIWMATHVLPVVPAWLEHAAWDSVTIVDITFPAFTTLLGAGMVIATRKGFVPRRLARRFLVLVGLGLLMNFLFGLPGTLDLSTLRLPGVLQLLGTVSLCIGALNAVLTTWRRWLAATLALAAALTAVHVTAIARCGGVVTRECNASRAVDLHPLWVGHAYHGGALGHDPEGLVSLLGALLSASVGATIMRIILHRSAAHAAGVSPTARNGAVALACFLGAAALSLLAPTWFGHGPIPVMKRLWTPPFALLVSSGVGAALLMLYLLLDTRHSKARDVFVAAMYPARALSRNSLLVFISLELANFGLHRPIGGASLSERLLAHAPAALLTFAVPAALIAVLVGICVALDRRAIYLRA